MLGRNLFAPLMTIILTLCVIGIAAVLAEIVLPGGVLGVLGALCLVGAVVATFVTHGTTAGVLAAIALVIFGLLALIAWMRWFHRLPFTRGLVLHETAGRSPAAPDSPVGREGIALTDLMPSGRAGFGDEKFDVIAEGAPIRKGEAVTVTGTSGPTLVVRALPS